MITSPKPAIIESDIFIKNVRCHYKWIYSYGDYYCFIKEYDENGELKGAYKDVLHFGQRNSDLKKLYFIVKQYNKEVAELFRILAHEVYGKHWSNNDRKRIGLNTIQIKRVMKERKQI